MYIKYAVEVIIMSIRITSTIIISDIDQFYIVARISLGSKNEIKEIYNILNIKYLEVNFAIINHRVRSLQSLKILKTACLGCNNATIGCQSILDILLLMDVYFEYGYLDKYPLTKANKKYEVHESLYYPNYYYVTSYA